MKHDTQKRYCPQCQRYTLHLIGDEGFTCRACQTFIYKIARLQHRKVAKTDSAPHPERVQGAITVCKEGVRKASGSEVNLPNDLSIIQTLRRMSDARSIRLALGVSGDKMGELLGAVHPNGHGGKPYTRQSVSMWERRGRQKKYQMTDDTREAYRIVVSDTVRLATAGRMNIKAKVSGRVWRFTPRVLCVMCGRAFTPARSTAKRCARCRR